MSFQAVSWAVGCTRVTDTLSKFVLVLLANYARPDGTAAFPSVQRMARETCMSERSVQRALRNLEAVGIIEQCDPKIVAAYITKADCRPRGYNILMVDAPNGVTRSHPVEGTGCRTVLNGVTHSPERGDTQSPNQLIEQLEEQTHASDFEALWLAYPRKVGKAAARKVFDRLMRDSELPTIEMLVSAVEVYALTITDLKFCAHLSTWLNGERWADGQQSAVVAPVRLDERLDSAMSAGAAHRLAGMTEQDLLESLAHRPLDEQTAALEQYRR